MFLFTPALVAWMACTYADKDTSPETGPVDTDWDTDANPAVLPEFVTVPAGTFEMGCTEGQLDCDPDETVHSVTLTHDTLVAVTEVTQWQFESTMGYNPSGFMACGPDCPVDGVSWHEAVAYANARSKAEGLQECYSCAGAGSDVVCGEALGPYECDGYRLLTEAEWENAARCGEDLRYAGSDDPSAVAWTNRNSEATTHAVASLAANVCGLYDMSGNVWEWAEDWFGDYGSVDVVDPTGPALGTTRNGRGGAWRGGNVRARVSYRDDGDPSQGYDNLGLRVARTQ